MSSLFVSSLPLHLVIAGTALAILLFVFLVGFCLPAWRQTRILKKVLVSLESNDLKEARDPQL
jgi:cobalamin biosynthesis protein CobD/CbiB